MHDGSGDQSYKKGIMMGCSRLTTTALAYFYAAFLVVTASAQSCGNFSQQINTKGLFFDNVTTIEIGPLPCPGMNGNSVGIPAAIHWHITPGANLSVFANVEGLVKPSLSEDGLTLSFEYGNGVSNWRGGAAGVEIVYPPGNVTTISCTGMANSIEITDDSGTLKRLHDRGGVNNNFYVTSTEGIQYAADSTNGTAEIDAPIVEVRMGGIDGVVQVKGMADAKMSGLRNKLVVEGDATVSATGVQSMVFVTGTFNVLTNTGHDNSVQATDATVTVTDMACTGPNGTAVCKDDTTLIGSSSATRATLQLAIACAAAFFICF